MIYRLPQLEDEGTIITPILFRISGPIIVVNIMYLPFQPPARQSLTGI
jgi:hypothetical protein